MNFRRILSDPKVKPLEHWKLITFLIGPNDFCIDICYRKTPEAIVNLHEENLLSVFRTFRDNLPRTMVNVIYPPDVAILKNLKPKPSQCVTLNHFECPCVFGFDHQSQAKRYTKIFKKYAAKLEEVANRFEFLNREVGQK
jgi:hypothetical protein